MLELVRSSIGSQLSAALAMLGDAIERCPDDLWAERVGERAFWEVAFHVAYYTDLYLTPPETPWPEPPPWAWPHAAGLGRTMEPPFRPLTPEETGPELPRWEVAAYVRSLTDKLRDSLSRETEASLAGPSGFFWLGMARAGVYLYNLRHVQHHAGQLCAVLRREGVSVEWQGMSSGPA